MGKIFFSILIIFVVFKINSQVTNERPHGFDVALKKGVPTIVMPEFDLEKIRLEDKTNDTKKSKVYRFGYEHNVSFGIDNSGVWENLSNGDRIWRVRVQSKGANTLNFLFDTYELPEGATLHLYNENRSSVLGAYTSSMNNNNSRLGTWLVDGDTITLEYYVPVDSNDVGKLSVSKVVHGYRSVSDFQARQKTLNSSGDCHLDVNCSIGQDFDPVKDRIKKAVALILVNTSGWCSGTLINNTSNNKAPYLLTAFHCGDGEAEWAFRFNWISENTVCASSEESISNGSDNYYQTTSGSKLLAKNAESDFRLVEITGGLDDSWDLEWAGWDRTGNVPRYSTSIHHPSGDIMKVSRYNGSLIKQRITIEGQNSAIWAVRDWDIGSTEPASSGSALFNNNGQIIGQLFGGVSFCTGTVDNGEPDFYGRFDVSWDFGATVDSRLSNWLDPENKNPSILKSLSEELGNPIITEGMLSEKVSIFPVPSIGIVNLINASGKELNYELFDVSGSKVNLKEVNSGTNELALLVEAVGVYFIRVSNIENDKDTFTRKIIVN